jgi:lysophospholipase L1-like esterase
VDYAARPMTTTRSRLGFSLGISLVSAIALGLAAGASGCSVELQASAGGSLQPTPSSSQSAPGASSDASTPTQDASTPPKDGGAKDASTPDAAPPPTFATFGRWDTRDAAGPRAAWPGSKIRFRFRGTRAQVRLDEIPGRGGPSEWDVAVDGTWSPNRLVPHSGKDVYVVADGLPQGDHSVELYRRTEAVGGRTQMLGVDLGAGTLLPPQPNKRRVFEFVGDSLTNGYGIEGAGATCPYTASTQNFHVTFAAQISNALDADEIGVAYQGKGLIKNYERANTLLYPELYGRILPDDAQSLWNPQTLVPDAVFVMLGANDYGQEKSQVFDPPSLAAFRTAYTTLLARIRANAPKAYILSFVGPSASDSTPAGYRSRSDQTAAASAAVTARQNAGDTRVSFVDVPAEPVTELTGCDYHPNRGVHDRLAAVLLPEVKRITGF